MTGTHDENQYETARQRTYIQAANVNESKEGTEQQKTGTNKPQQHKHNYDTNPKHREYYFKTEPKSGKPLRF